MSPVKPYPLKSAIHVIEELNKKAVEIRAKFSTIAFVCQYTARSIRVDTTITCEAIHNDLDVFTDLVRRIGAHNSETMGMLLVRGKRITGTGRDKRTERVDYPIPGPYWER